MSVKTEKYYLGDLLKSEYQDRNTTREAVTIVGAVVGDRTVPLGTVLGKATKGEATSAAGAGNTGDGVITEHPAVKLEAKLGVYKLLCIAAAAGAALFSVEDPDGIQIGVATQGVEFDTHLTFT